MQPQHPKFQLVFSVIMAANMVTVVTFVITSVNIGWQSGFLLAWAKAFAIAYVIATPVIYYFAPIVRSWTTKLLES